MKKRAFLYMCVVLGIIIIGLNLVAFYTPFCDAYRNTVYGFIADNLGTLTGYFFPFAVGEVLMFVFAGIIILFVILSILFIFLRNKIGYKKLFFFYSKFTIFLCLLTLLVYTLNWSIPFRGSVLTVNGAEDRKYKLEEVINVRNYLVSKINETATMVERDEDGKVVYNDLQSSEAITESMHELASQYPLLEGYYPPMKKAVISDILEMMSIGGYTYPYTMEVTYNKYCTSLYYPFLFAHESSHHQGYYKESEANYLAFLGCINSRKMVDVYSGYLEIYYYFEEEVMTRLISGGNEDLASSLPGLSSQVINDISDAITESKELYEKESHPAEKFSEQINDVSKTGWDVQDDVLKEDNYDGVVKLVLEYYDVNPFELNE